MTLKPLFVFVVLFSMSYALPLSKRPTLTQSQENTQYKVSTTTDGLATTTMYTLFRNVNQDETEMQYLYSPPPTESNNQAVNGYNYDVADSEDSNQDTGLLPEYNDYYYEDDVFYLSDFTTETGETETHVSEDSTGESDISKPQDIEEFINGIIWITSS